MGGGGELEQSIDEESNEEEQPQVNEHSTKELLKHLSNFRRTISLHMQHVVECVEMQFWCEKCNSDTRLRTEVQRFDCPF